MNSYETAIHLPIPLPGCSTYGLCIHWRYVCSTICTSTAHEQQSPTAHSSFDDGPNSPKFASYIGLASSINCANYASSLWMLLPFRDGWGSSFGMTTGTRNPSWSRSKSFYNIPLFSSTPIFSWTLFPHTSLWRTIFQPCSAWVSA